MEYKNKTILIIGGNSDVGKAIAIDFAKKGCHLILTSRKGGQLESFRSDLEIRYSIKCEISLLDILDFESHKMFYENLSKKPNIVVTAIGYLDNQEESQENFKETLKSIQSNYTGLVSILNIISNDFEIKRAGTIVGISSVAGDRGRGSNYIYGSSKAAYSAYLSGLRNRLIKSNVHVITVKPGFIQTKMTENLELPKLLTATPNEISNSIFKAIKKKRNVVYSKWFWKWIMLIIKFIPEEIFKKLSL